MDESGKCGERSESRHRISQAEVRVLAEAGVEAQRRPVITDRLLVA